MSPVVGGAAMLVSFLSFLAGWWCCLIWFRAERREIARRRTAMDHWLRTPSA